MSFTISEGALTTWMGEAISLGGDLGITVRPLKSQELVRFGRAFQRQFIREMEDRGWNISRTVCPPGLRFVIMPHVDVDCIDRLTTELAEVI